MIHEIYIHIDAYFQLHQFMPFARLDFFQCKQPTSVWQSCLCGLAATIQQRENHLAQRLPGAIEYDQCDQNEAQGR